MMDFLEDGGHCLREEKYAHRPTMSARYKWMEYKSQDNGLYLPDSFQVCLYGTQFGV